MDDNKTLLELAAKAVGLKKDNSPYAGGGRGNTGFDIAGNMVLNYHNGVVWNPLKNDGDALRLCVNLRMEIDHNHPSDDAKPWVMASAGNGMYGEVYFAAEDQRISATRQAIVKCAAKIGSAMP